MKKLPFLVLALSLILATGTIAQTALMGFINLPNSRDTVVITATHLNGQNYEVKVKIYAPGSWVYSNKGTSDNSYWKTSGTLTQLSIGADAGEVTTGELRLKGHKEKSHYTVIAGSDKVPMITKTKKNGVTIRDTIFNSIPAYDHISEFRYKDSLTLTQRVKISRKASLITGHLVFQRGMKRVTFQNFTIDPKTLVIFGSN